VSDRNRLRITPGALTVVPRGLDRLWGFRRLITVPLGSIRDVSVEYSPLRVPQGWRGPGLGLFLKSVGTFHPDGERHYWNYAAPGEALSIRLDGTQHFHQLHLSVADAEASRRWILDALGDVNLN